MIWMIMSGFLLNVFNFHYAARCIYYIFNLLLECLSFDYCADIGLCAISDTHPGDGTVVPTFHQMCDVFSSTYLYLTLCILMDSSFCSKQ